MAVPQVWHVQHLCRADYYHVLKTWRSGGEEVQNAEELNSSLRFIPNKLEKQIIRTLQKLNVDGEKDYSLPRTLRVVPGDVSEDLEEETRQHNTNMVGTRHQRTRCDQRSLAERKSKKGEANYTLQKTQTRTGTIHSEEPHSRTKEK